MTAGPLALLFATSLSVAAPAAAQAPAGTPARPARDREWSVGGSLTGRSSMGDATATLLGSGGEPSVGLFRTENRFGAVAGPELAIAFRFRPDLWIEVAGALTRASLTSRVTNDADGAPAFVVSTPVIRVSAEAGVLWYFRGQDATAWFLRGGAGFLREGSGTLALAENGLLASGGVGFRHWWRTNGTGAFKRVGLRAEGRGVFLMSGINLGERALRFGPAGVLSLVVGY